MGSVFAIVGIIAIAARLLSTVNNLMPLSTVSA